MLVSSQCQNVTRHVTSEPKYTLGTIHWYKIHLTSDSHPSQNCAAYTAFSIFLQTQPRSCMYLWSLSFMSQHLHKAVRRFSIDVAAYHKADWCMHGISHYETLLYSSKSQSSLQTNWKLFYVIFPFYCLLTQYTLFYLGMHSKKKLQI